MLRASPPLVAARAITAAARQPGQRPGRPGIEPSARCRAQCAAPRKSRMRKDVSRRPTLAATGAPRGYLHHPSPALPRRDPVVRSSAVFLFVLVFVVLLVVLFFRGCFCFGC